MSAREGQGRLTIVPCELREANAFIARHHRHHAPVVGHRFSLAVADDSGAVRGVATVGRPVARLRQDGWTLEVTRVCTDGCPNACSALYQAAWRVGKALGYRRIGTYILATEPGVSLQASGWTEINATAGGGTWDRRERPRVDTHPVGQKRLWEPAELHPAMAGGRS